MEGEDPDPFAQLAHQQPAASDQLLGLAHLPLHGHQESERSEEMDLEHGVARELGQKTLAPRGRLVRRSRPQEERDREPLDDLTLLETIVRTTRMLEGLL